MAYDLLLLALGLLLLLGGGEALVKGAISLANRLGLSPLIIGLTVVGFGTSTPELLVSLQAALRGAPDIAVGNVVGSNIANILLILGVSAMVSPITVKISGLPRDVSVMVVAALVMCALGWLGNIPRWAGFLMIAVIIGYVATVAILDRRKAAELEADDEIKQKMAGWKEALALIGGLITLMFGADLLVDAATRLALGAGVSEAVIGLTIVAVGTSLPELATSLIAAFRGHSEVAVGNVVGSNIFNIFAILGVTASVMPIPVASTMAHVDIPLMLAVTLGFAAIVFLWHRISRRTGTLMVLGYAGYTWALFAF